MLISSLKKIKWWVWFIIIDSLLVILTGLALHMKSGGLVGFLHQNFRLDIEMNLAVWWAGACLMNGALLSYELYKTESQESKRNYHWIILCIILFGLSFDEIGSIHERIFENWTALIITAFFGALFFIPILWKLIFTNRTHRSGIFLAVGFGLMALAIPQEYMEHHLIWPNKFLGLRAGLEEGTELFGSLMVLVGLVGQRRGKFWPNSISRVINYPYRMTPYFLMIGLILQIFISAVTVKFVDVSHRGNPAVFLPAFAFLILANSVFWKAYERSGYRRWIWIFFSLLLYLASSLTLCALWLGTLRINLFWIFCFFIILFGVFVLYDKISWLKIICLFMVLISFFFVNTYPIVDYILPSLFAVYLGLILKSDLLHHKIPKI